MKGIDGGAKLFVRGMGNVGVSGPRLLRNCCMGWVFGRVLGEDGVCFLGILA